MVIEHVFVTTLDAPQALTAAAGFLARRGFGNARDSAFPLADPQWTSLEMRRGRKNANRAKSVAELPQVIRIDFDRGRVTVAASITPSFAWGGSQWTGFGIGTATEKPKKMGMHQDLLTGIVTGLERVLVHGDAPESAAVAWERAELVITDAARRRRRRRLITLAAVVGVLAGVVTLIVIAADM